MLNSTKCWLLRDLPKAWESATAITVGMQVSGGVKI